MAQFRSEHIFRGKEIEKDEWIPDELEGSPVRKGQKPVSKNHSDSQSRTNIGGRGSANQRDLSSKTSLPKGMLEPGTKGSGDKLQNSSSGGLQSWVPTTRVSGDDKRIIGKSVEKQQSKVNVRNSAGKSAVDPVTISRSTDPIFRQTLMANGAASVDLLRKWYWERVGQSSDQSGVYSIPSRERIFVILLSAGKTALEFMYSIMTPVERRQFHDILKTPPALSINQITSIRREFIRSLNSLDMQ